MKKEAAGKRNLSFVWLGLICLAAFLLSVCYGSVSISPAVSLRVIKKAVEGLMAGEILYGADAKAAAILIPVRVPRVICAALIGAALSVSGAAMQGLLKNPLADGSTMGVASGASLGAVLAIAFGAGSGFFGMGTVASASVFAFLALISIIAITYKLDSSLSTNTIILTGVVFSMFVSSITSLVISFAGDRVRTITFWTLGSLQSASYRNAALLFASLIIFGGVMLAHGEELNAFAIGEEDARSIGVNIRRTKLLILICVSAVTGICVSVGGTIGFVGLVIPHLIRRITGPDHKKLLPACVLGGASFLMLSDLLARLILRPRELPIGVVTSMVGTLMFLVIFYRSRGGTGK